MVLVVFMYFGRRFTVHEEDTDASKRKLNKNLGAYRKQEIEGFHARFHQIRYIGILEEEFVPSYGWILFCNDDKQSWLRIAKMMVAI
jgi:hypothetical protein